MKAQNSDMKKQAIAAVGNMQKKAADAGYMSDDDINAEIKAARLLIAEHARLEGVKGRTVDEFEKNMKNAIAKGANACKNTKII